jgi:hypothetical protein
MTVPYRENEMHLQTRPRRTLWQRLRAWCDSRRVRVCVEVRGLRIYWPHDDYMMVWAALPHFIASLQAHDGRSPIIITGAFRSSNPPEPTVSVIPAHLVQLMLEKCEPFERAWRNDPMKRYTSGEAPEVGYTPSS